MSVVEGPLGHIREVEDITVDSCRWAKPEVSRICTIGM